MMLQRARRVQRDQTGDRPGGERVRQSRGGEKRGVRPGDVWDDEETEEFGRDRQRGGRDEEPAGKNCGDRQGVQRALDQRGEQVFPWRDRSRGGRRPHEPVDEARRRQHKDDKAEGLVRLVEIERRRRAHAHVDHDKTVGEEFEDQRADEPMKRDDERAPALRPRLRAQISAASLEIVSSTLRETSGKPEFMPNSSRSIVVSAWNARRSRPPAVSRATVTSTLSGFVTPSRVSWPEMRTVWSFSRWTEAEIEVDRRVLRRIEKSRRAHVVVERGRADVDRTGLHMKGDAASVRMLEVDRNAPLESAEPARGARVADRVDRERDLGARGIEPPVRRRGGGRLRRGDGDDREGRA